jgi:hypothetical protein
MFTIQSLIAIAVVVGVAAAWTIAITMASALWQRDQARTASPAHQPAGDDVREPVLH